MRRNKAKERLNGAMLKQLRVEAGFRSVRALWMALGGGESRGKPALIGLKTLHVAEAGEPVDSSVRFILAQKLNVKPEMLLATDPVDESQPLITSQADVFGASISPSVNEARIEQLLELYCAQLCQEWQRSSGELFYVEPHYSTLPAGKVPQEMETRRLRAPTERQKSDYEPLDRSGARVDELTRLLEHAKGTRRLCLTEVSGTGKSVFTRRLLGFFSSEESRALFDGQPCLAIRFEAGAESVLPDSSTGYRAALHSEVAKKVAAASEAEINTVVDAAINAGRLVLILDAVDQVTLRDRKTRRQTDEAAAVAQFVADVEAKSGKRCWLILTGRTYAAKPHELSLLGNEGDWRYARIDGFDEEQQYEYLTHPAGLPLIAVIPDDQREAARKQTKRVAEQFAEKVILDETYRGEMRRMQVSIPIRVPESRAAEMLADPRRVMRLWNTWKNDPLVEILDLDRTGTQEDLYVRNMEGLFPNYDEIAELMQLPVVLFMIRTLHSRGLTEPFKTRTELYLYTSRELILRAADANDVEHVERILAATAFELATSGTEYLANDRGYVVHGSESVKAIEENTRIRCGAMRDDEWSQGWNAARETVLADRAIIETFDHEILGFRHKSIQEFYCGLHLAKYAAKDSTLHLEKLDLHSWEWHWPLRFMIEMPAGFRNEDSLKLSLSPLFCSVPKDGRRASELIFRAWELLKNLDPNDRRLVAKFQADFQTLLKSGNALARQLVPEQQLVELVELTTEETEEITKRPFEQRNYARCPPASLSIDSEPFWMGAHKDEIRRVGVTLLPGEGPRHQVRVAPFYLQTTAVTREQYALYDASLAKQMAEWSPQNNCPAVALSWYDAWCFALWVGGRLPTECEWEYACRAGKDTPKDHFWFGDQLNANTEANFNPTWREDPFRAEGKMTYREKTIPVKDLPPNDWGLHQMHGNVAEWCGDWFNPDWYKTRTKGVDEAALTTEVFPADSGPTVGSLRVLRGGGWRNHAENCRSARRRRGAPADCYSHVGFRLLFDC